jgi:hypothetical protein
MSFSFKTFPTDSKTAISLLLFCKRTGIDYVPELSQFEIFVCDAILQKHITPGEYKELFHNNLMYRTLDEAILTHLSECKTRCVRAMKIEEDPIERKILTDRARQAFNDEDFVQTFLERAKSKTPDVMCGCSSQTCE